MPPEFFECYPFESNFEEDVFSFLSKILDDKFYLVHNVMRPNKDESIFVPKEIDLFILSKLGTIFVIELKGNSKAPVIDDVSMNEKPPNPVYEMKRYGQNLREELLIKEHLKFYTNPYLILKKKDRKKISGTWKPNCLDIQEFGYRILDHSRSSKHLRFNITELRRVREKYLCSTNIEPFSGFFQNDFNKLREYKTYYDSFNDRYYYETILKPFYYKLRALGYEIRSRFRAKGITLYQHISTPRPTVPKPIQFLAFILKDSEQFLTQPQLAFHISSKNWYKPDQPDEDHFSVKLAFFESSEWLRKLLLKFRTDPPAFLSKLKNTLGSKHYFFIATLTANDNLISKPIKDLTLEDIEKLAHRAIDKRQYIRGIGFEKPVYYSNHKNLGKKPKLIQFLCKEFQILYELLNDIFPEYFNAKN